MCGYKIWSLTLGEENRLRDLVKKKYVQYVQEYSCKWIKTLMNNNTEPQHAQYNKRVQNDKSTMLFIEEVRKVSCGSTHGRNIHLQFIKGNEMLQI